MTVTLPNLTFSATAAAEHFNGGAGFDTVNYGLATGPVTVNLGNPALSRGFALGDRFYSIEAIIGSRFGDSLIGDNNRNVLNGAGGNDFIFGLGGDDVLIGGDGYDYLDGGTGFDLASYETSSVAVIANLGNWRFNGGGAYGDRYLSLEGLTGSRFDDTLIGDNLNNLLAGGTGADILFGLDGSDKLFGDAGNDKLYGNGGNDALYGGDGDDLLLGSGGADYLDGGAGFDTISYADAAFFVTVNLGNPALNDGAAAGDRTVSIENVLGSRFGDSLIGDNNRNVLNGAEGNDILYGLGGDDVLIGGTGADRLIGGTGFDLVSYETSHERVVVNLLSPALNQGDARGDLFNTVEGILGGSGNDDLTGDNGNNLLLGSGGNDFLYGKGGNDRIEGGIGHDRLEGGAGADYLSGGLGSDSFVFFVTDFTTKTEDVIADFDTTPAGDNDVIKLAGLAGKVTYAQDGDDALILINAYGCQSTIRVLDADAKTLWHQVFFV
jgi:Ca2+-binding RTX toxin-like protein